MIFWGLLLLLCIAGVAVGEAATKSGSLVFSLLVMGLWIAGTTWVLLQVAP